MDALGFILLGRKLEFLNSFRFIDQLLILTDEMLFFVQLYFSIRRSDPGHNFEIHLNQR